MSELLLHGCLTKVARAKEHLGMLKSSVESFTLDREAYSIVKEMDTDTGVHTLRLQIYRDPTLDDWALLIGDCIHNMRSALDHLFWALVLLKYPNGTNTWSPDAAFPITRHKHIFESRKPRLEQWVGKNVTEMLENMQPYQGAGPDKNALLFIHEWDITDKHKLLVPLVWIAEQGELTFERGGKHPSPAIHTTFHAARMENDAVIATIKVSPPDAVMDVDFNPTLGIVFETDPIAHIVIPALESLIGVVESVIKDFDPLFNTPS